MDGISIIFRYEIQPAGHRRLRGFDSQIRSAVESELVIEKAKEVLLQQLYLINAFKDLNSGIKSHDAGWLRDFEGDPAGFSPEQTALLKNRLSAAFKRYGPHLRYASADMIREAATVESFRGLRLFLIYMPKQRGHFRDDQLVVVFGVSL